MNASNIAFSRVAIDSSLNAEREDDVMEELALEDKAAFIADVVHNEDNEVKKEHDDALLCLSDELKTPKVSSTARERLRSVN